MYMNTSVSVLAVNIHVYCAMEGLDWVTGDWIIFITAQNFQVCTQKDNTDQTGEVKSSVLLEVSNVQKSIPDRQGR